MPWRLTPSSDPTFVSIAGLRRSRPARSAVCQSGSVDVRNSHRKGEMVRSKKVHVLPNQLNLFSGHELETCALSTLGPCPVCASPRVFLRKRVRISQEKICGQCDHIWGTPRL